MTALYSFLKKAILCLSIFLGFAQSQYLETTIYLPDSLCGVSMPYLLLYNRTNNKIYVGGEEGNVVIVIDGVTNEKIARIPVGRHIKAFCWNSQNNKVYVASPQKVTVIDGVSNNIITTIAIESYSPYSLVYNSCENTIYSDCINAVYVIDGGTNEVIDTILVEGTPLGLLYNPAGNKVYCVRGGLHETDVLIIDGATNNIISTILFDRRLASVCMSYNSVSNKVYCSYDSSVAVIDGVGDSLIKTIINTSNPSPRAAAYNSTNNKLYLVSVGQSSITVIDGAGDSLLKVINLSSPLVYDVCYNQLDNKIYSISNNNITVIDGVSDSVITEISNVGQFPYVLIHNPQTNLLYCGNRNSSNVAVIDCANNSLIARVILSMGPIDLVFNPTNGRIYCANYYNRSVSVIDGATNEVIKTIPVQIFPRVLTYNSLNNKIYCAGDKNNSVKVIDCLSDTVIKSISIGSPVWELTYNELNNKIYTANKNTGSVSVIDGDADTIIANCATGMGPSDVLWTNGSNKVYCINSLDNKITAIDGETNGIVAQIFTGQFSLSLCYNSRNNKIYWWHPGMGGDYIAIADCRADSIIRDLLCPSNPIDNWETSLYNPQSNKVYYALREDLMIIDGVGDTVTQIIEFPSHDICEHLGFDFLSNKVYVSVDYGDGHKVVVVDGQTDTIITAIPVDLGANAFAFNPFQNRIYVANQYGSSISVIREGTGSVENYPKITQEKGGWISIEPNPMSAYVKISYCLIKSGNVRIKLYNASGQYIRTLIQGYRHPGIYHTIWRSGEDKRHRRLSGGIYFIVMETEDSRVIRKLVLVR